MQTFKELIMNMYKNRSYSIYDGRVYELTDISCRFCTLVGFSIYDGNFYQLIAKSIQSQQHCPT